MSWKKILLSKAINQKQRYIFSEYSGRINLDSSLEYKLGIHAEFNDYGYTTISVTDLYVKNGEHYNMLYENAKIDANKIYYILDDRYRHSLAYQRLKKPYNFCWGFERKSDFYGQRMTFHSIIDLPKGMMDIEVWASDEEYEMTHLNWKNVKVGDKIYAEFSDCRVWEVIKVNHYPQIEENWLRVKPFIQTSTDNKIEELDINWNERGSSSLYYLPYEDNEDKKREPISVISKNNIKEGDQLFLEALDYFGEVEVIKVYPYPDLKNRWIRIKTLIPNMQDEFVEKDLEWSFGLDGEGKIYYLYDDKRAEENKDPKKDLLKTFNESKNELELLPLAIRQEDKVNVQWLPISEAAHYIVEVYSYIDDNYRVFGMPTLYKLKTFEMDRNSCFLALDNILDNIIVRVTAENRAGETIAQSRGIVCRSGISKPEWW